MHSLFAADFYFIEVLPRFGSMLPISPMRYHREFAGHTRGSFQKYGKFPGVDQDAQDLVQHAFPGSFPGGITSEEAFHLRMSRHLAFGHRIVVHFVHPSLLHSLILYLFQHALVLVMHLDRSEIIDGNRTESMLASGVGTGRQSKMQDLYATACPAARG